MLNESTYPESKIILLKKLLEEKQEELQKRNTLNLKKHTNSKFSKWYNLAIVVLFLALITQLFFIINPDKKLFKTKAANLKDNFSELALLYQNQREKDSIKLVVLQDKIAAYQEKREIDSILREQEIIDSLYFEDPKLVVTITYPINNQEKGKSFKKANKPLTKINTYQDYTKQNTSQRKVAKTKPVSKERYYLAADKFTVYPKCAGKSSEVKKRKCLNAKIKKFVSKKINKKLFKNKGIERVEILIGVNKKGIAKALRIRGTTNKLQENEIVKAIAALPKFIPARKNNYQVGVKFNLSIPF